MPYTSFTFDELIAQTTTSAEIITRQSSTGRYLFCAHGARLLGLYPGDFDFNVLWVYHNIRTSIDEGQWLCGGERLWLAPERAFFYENPRDFEGYHVPAGIDPGDYIIAGELTFHNTFSVLNALNNDTYDDCTSRRVFTLTDDPYRTGLAFAGVTVRDQISLAHPQVDMAAWSVTQLYTCGEKRPGTALFAVREHPVPLNYLGTVPAHRLGLARNTVRFRIDGADMYTCAIRPEDLLPDTICKVLYLSPCPWSEHWFCVMKRSRHTPLTQSECVDVSQENPEGLRGAVQAHNSGPDYLQNEFIPFGEINIQLPKGANNGEQTLSDGTHELLSYIGTRDEILALARQALTLPETPCPF